MQDTTLSSVCYWKGAAWRSTSKFKHSHVTNFLTREKDKEGEETQMPDIFLGGGAKDYSSSYELHSSSYKYLTSQKIRK